MSANPQPDHTAIDALEAEARALMLRVGDRVRKARALKGVPRRVISERSGVSPRYIAQLEAGEGNISIALLQRVAMALGQEVEGLIARDDPWTSDTAQLTRLFRHAGDEQRRQALHALGADGPGDRRANRFCLIGLRGAGKSTLGTMAGQHLGLPFLELNAEIEQDAGMPVAEVVALYGQEGYRHLEARALDRVIASHDEVILAAAGGIVAEPETFTTLLACFHTIWLQARPAEHMSRVLGQGDTRPMAGNPEAMQQLRHILQSRQTLYERAGARLDTSGKSLDESVDDLTTLIHQTQQTG